MGVPTLDDPVSKIHPFDFGNKLASFSIVLGMFMIDMFSSQIFYRKKD